MTATLYIAIGVAAYAICFLEISYQHFVLQKSSIKPTVTATVVFVLTPTYPLLTALLQPTVSILGRTVGWLVLAPVAILYSVGIIILVPLGFLLAIFGADGVKILRRLTRLSSP